MIEHRRYGPPGTGKTDFLSRQAPIAAAKYGTDGVAICSLTRAAATEIGSRVPDLPHGSVGTLHSFCFRGLEMSRDSMAEGRKGLEIWNRHVAGRAPMWRIESRRNQLDPENAPAEAFASWTSDGERLLAEIGIHRARRTDPRFWPPEARRFMRMWTEFKTANGLTDFTDLLERGLTELDSCPGEPAVLMADEAQDMSALEFALLRSWAAHTEQLVTVGDPDQALYSWRGSDPEAFTAAPATTVETLSRSYRVPRAVHAYAVDWIQRVPGRVPTEYLPRLTDEAAERVRRGDADAKDTTLPVAEGSVVRAPYRYEQPDAMVPELLELAGAGERVMVLASCGFMLLPLLKALRDRGAPFHNPYRIENGAWNPLAGAGKLLNYLRPDVDTFGDAARLWTWPEVHSWVEPLAAKGTTRRGAKSIIEHQAQPADRFEEAAERKGHPGPPVPVDLLKLAALFEDEAAYRITDVGTDTPAAVNWWWEHVRESRRGSLGYPVSVYRKYGGRALSAKPKIIVGTVHSTKGGWADHVFVFPDISRAAFWGGYDRPGPARDAITRQFYVAFTRAREGLHLCRESGAEFVRFPAPKEAT